MLLHKVTYMYQNRISYAFTAHQKNQPNLGDNATFLKSLSEKLPVPEQQNFFGLTSFSLDVHSVPVTISVSDQASLVRCASCPRSVPKIFSNFGIVRDRIVSKCSRRVRKNALLGALLKYAL